MIALGVVMDPIGALHYEKDSTLAMLWEAQARGWKTWYLEQDDLYMQGAEPYGRCRRLTVYKDANRWFELGEEAVMPLSALDAILMRKDPPFDLEYLYTTHVLEFAETRGTVVVNRPQSLRDANEKIFALRFPQCIPPTLVTREPGRLKAFLGEHGDIVLKPLDIMGGASVFRVRRDDPNITVIFATMTANGTRTTMAQRFLPAIAEGDKRILLVDGNPVPYALARIPAPGEFRGNLAAGGTGVGLPLTKRDRWICGEVGPTLKERGLVFVGLDVIGDHLTEINVTSPTCIRELDKLYGLNIAGQVLDAVAARVGLARSRAGSLQ